MGFADNLLSSFIQSAESMRHVSGAQKRPPVQANDEAPVALPASGRSCHRKCKNEMKDHLIAPCDHLEARLSEAQSGKEDDLVHSIKNALNMCKQGQQHHDDYCKWRCPIEEHVEVSAFTVGV